MVERISNEILTAEVSDIGPELYSLSKGSREYIWQRDPHFWASSSPLLFPNVGRQKNDAFIIGHRVYPIGIHGITRSLETMLCEKSEDCLTFESRPTAQTLEAYPFDFRILSNFKIDGNTLSVYRTVFNSGNTLLPFCIGEHTGFCCDPADAMLSFELEENTTRAVLNHDHYIGHDEEIALKNMPLNDSEFLRGAYILRSCRSTYVSLINKDQEVLRVYRGDYPAFAIWRKLQAPFICIETIHGFDSDATDTEDLFAKKSLVTLCPKEQKTFTYSITLK